MRFTDSSRGVSIAKDPAVVKFNGGYFMYYSISPGHGGMNGWDIGIARSSDLDNWQKVSEMGRQGTEENDGICAPGAIVIDGLLHLFYQSYGRGSRDAICHATSADGLHFTRDPQNPIFRPTGEWNNGRAIDADTVIFGEHLYLYFATRDPEGKTQMIGAARARLRSEYSRADFTQRCDRPVIKPELSWEQECIEAPATTVKDGKVYMFYAGAYNNCPQQIGLAVSEDAVNFSRVSDAPFLPNGIPGSWNSSESGHPYIFEDDDGKTHLFYQGNDSNGKSWYISRAEVVFENGRFALRAKK